MRELALGNVHLKIRDGWVEFNKSLEGWPSSFMSRKMKKKQKNTQAQGHC